ncbi:MAG: DUF559 domain-containing protein [Pirellulaceae bacterium]|nr:DUF559 domain-containing protein [Pirellulaceae bacterium]
MTSQSRSSRNSPISCWSCAWTIAGAVHQSSNARTARCPRAASSSWTPATAPTGTPHSQSASVNEFANTVWQWVRNRQIGSQKFRREYAIPPYTTDFCCVELGLILEVDGADHLTEDGRQRDRVQSDFLNRQGYRVVRISGYDVLREPGSCRARIAEQVQQRIREMETEHPSPPAPSPRSEERGDRD